MIPGSVEESNREHEIPQASPETTAEAPISLQQSETVASMRAACKAARAAAGPGSTLALVPTMGALHEGHLSLIRAARERADVVAVSLFVNPTQFGPGEDLDRYPRTFAADRALLEREGVDLLFAPSAAEMYPNGFGQAGAGTETWVDVPSIGSRLDGHSRPGHFRGVATVVSKLFGIVGPDLAFFGQKDAAQVAVLRAMVRDLNLPVDLVICPTIRDPDGLALSSRNRHLSPIERVQALALPRALETARTLAATGCESPRMLEEMLRADLNREPGIRLDYAEVVHPETLLPVGDLREGALVAVAAYVGQTRLIDNLLLPPAGSLETRR